jgi:hypothetical protein
MAIISYSTALLFNDILELCGNGQRERALAKKRTKHQRAHEAKRLAAKKAKKAAAAQKSFGESVYYWSLPRWTGRGNMNKDLKGISASKQVAVLAKQVRIRRDGYGYGEE